MIVCNQVMKFILDRIDKDERQAAKRRKKEEVVEAKRRLANASKLSSLLYRHKESLKMEILKKRALLDKELQLEAQVWTTGRRYLFCVHVFKKVTTSPEGLLHHVCSGGTKKGSAANASGEGEGSGRRRRSHSAATHPRQQFSAPLHNRYLSAQAKTGGGEGDGDEVQEEEDDLNHQYKGEQERHQAVLHLQDAIR